MIYLIINLFNQVIYFAGEKLSTIKGNDDFNWKSDITMDLIKISIIVIYDSLERTSSRPQGRIRIFL